MHNAIRATALSGALVVAAVGVSWASPASAEPIVTFRANFGQCQAAAAQAGFDLGQNNAPGQTGNGPSSVVVTIDFGTNPPTITSTVHGPTGENDPFDFLFACSFPQG